MCLIKEGTNENLAMNQYVILKENMILSFDSMSSCSAILFVGENEKCAAFHYSARFLLPDKSENSDILLIRDMSELTEIFATSSKVKCNKEKIWDMCDIIVSQIGTIKTVVIFMPDCSTSGRIALLDYEALLECLSKKMQGGGKIIRVPSINFVTNWKKKEWEKKWKSIDYV